MRSFATFILGALLLTVGCGSQATIVSQAGPMLISLAPPASTVHSAPTQVVATFSKPVTVPASAFTIGGTCAIAPTVGLVALDGTRTIATVQLTGGSCSDAQVLTVSINPRAVTDLEGVAGSGDAVTQPYTVQASGPTVTLGPPSVQLLGATGLATLSVTFAAPPTVSTTLTGSLTTSGGSVFLTRVSGSATCDVAVTAISTAGAVIFLSNCAGNGTLSVSVGSGVVRDTLGNTSSASAPSALITVDTTAPTLVSLLPASATLQRLPTQFVSTFREPVRSITAANVAIDGTCTTLPTVGSVTLDSTQTVATASLVGGLCTDGQSLTVTVGLSGILDLAGNAAAAMSSLTQTYTVQTSGPTVILGAPSTPLLATAGTTTLSVTFTAPVTGSTALTGTLTARGGGVILNNVSGSATCNVTVVGISTSGATVCLSDCAGNGTFKVIVASGAVRDTLGNASSESAPSALITVDDIAPTGVDLAPVSAVVQSAPTHVVATFSEAIRNFTAANIAVSGACTTPPTVGNVTLDSTQTIATVLLVGGVCTDGQTLTVTVSLPGIFDLAGNTARGDVPLAQTYTVQTAGPTVIVGAPSALLLAAAASTTLDITFIPAATGSTVLAGSLTAGGRGVQLNTVSGNATCDVAVTGMSVTGASVVLSRCSGDGILTVNIQAGAVLDTLGNPSSGSAASARINVDNTSPTVVSLSPASAALRSAPTQLVATFSEAIHGLTPASIALSGGCTTAPTVNNITLDSTQTVATASLVGGVCANGQTLTVTVSLSGISDLAGNAATSSAAATQNYTVQSLGPTITLGDPSALLVGAAGHTSLAATFTAPATGSTVLTGSLTSSGGGVLLHTTSGSAGCSVSVTGMSAAGASIMLSQCSGNGTLTISIQAGAVRDNLSNPSSASAVSAVITVDTTSPTLVSLSPPSAASQDLPTQFVTTFSEAIRTINASSVALSGTCTRLPTIGAITLDSTQTIATASLIGGTCTNGQRLFVSVSPANIVDIAGNNAVGAVLSATYVVATSGPVIALNIPLFITLYGSSTLNMSLVVEHSYGGATSLTGTLTAAGGGITQTVLSGTPACNVAVNNITPINGATVVLSGCTGDGTFTVHVDAGVAVDALGNISTVSAESNVITVHALPTLGKSTMSLDKDSAPADEKTPITVTVTLEDAGNAPVAYQNVVLKTSGLTLLRPASGKTDDKGVFKASLTSSFVGSQSVTATFSAGTLTQNVNFIITPACNGTLMLPGVPAPITGLSPFSEVSADFNGDGKRDIAVADLDASTLSVFLGNGDGTFERRAVYPAASNPAAVTSGDFDGNGKPDLALASNDDTVSVFINNGDGTFKPLFSFPVGSEPVSLVSVNFDGNVGDDLAVVNEVDNTLTLLMSNGDGTFQLQAIYNTGAGPTSVVEADFDGNGHGDLAVLNSGENTVSVLLNDGNGTFQAEVPYATGKVPHTVATADFNGDGRIDLVATNQQDNTVSLLIGNGDGTLKSQIVLNAGPSPAAVVAADFDHDGKQDYAVTTTGNNLVTVMLGNDDTTFASPGYYAAGGISNAMVVDDFNRDGKLDMVAAVSSASKLTVLLGYGDGTFPAASSSFSSTGQGPRSVIVADFNNDGEADLAQAHWFESTVGILLGSGSGTFQMERSIAISHSSYAVAADDLNGDSNTDLIVLLNSADEVIIMLGNGDATFQVAMPYATQTGPASVSIADLNGDGYLDLAVANCGANAGGTLTILLGNGDGTFQAKAVGDGGSTPASLQLADLNADGAIDVVSVGNGNVMNVALGNGDGTFAAVTTFMTGAGSIALTVADFNGDGQVDAAAVNQFDGTVSVLIGEGDGTFATQVAYPVGTEPSAVTSSDLNGDNTVDILVANSGNATLGVLLGAGDGTFLPQISYFAGTYPYAVAAADFNGDSKPDVAISNLDGAQTTVLLSSGCISQ